MLQAGCLLWLIGADWINECIHFSPAILLLVCFEDVDFSQGIHKKPTVNISEPR